MSESSIRATIKTTLESASGIGIVHDYMRDSRSPAKFIALLTPTLGTTVNGWMFSRTATQSEWTDFDSRLKTHVFTIEGYYELNDLSASEKTFQGIIEAIANACDVSPSLNSLNPTPPLQVNIVDTKEVGDKLYHHCTLFLSVQEEV